MGPANIDIDKLEIQLTELIKVNKEKEMIMARTVFDMLDSGEQIEVIVKRIFGYSLYISNPKCFNEIEKYYERLLNMCEAINQSFGSAIPQVHNILNRVKEIKEQKYEH